MDKELKAKWVAALRSGEYRQGVGRLVCEDGAMCCLGVLRHIADPSDGDAACNGGTITEKQRDRYGIGPDFPIHHLTNMNDGLDVEDGERPGKQFSFAEIADYIEANL